MQHAKHCQRSTNIGVVQKRKEEQCWHADKPQAFQCSMSSTATGLCMAMTHALYHPIHQSNQSIHPSINQYCRDWYSNSMSVSYRKIACNTQYSSTTNTMLIDRSSVTGHAPTSYTNAMPLTTTALTMYLLVRKLSACLHCWLFGCLFAAHTILEAS
jgi:hypothetical protein